MPNKTLSPEKPHKNLAIACLSIAAPAFTCAHGDEARAKNTGTIKKEQTEWGIAGEAKAVKRAVRLTMSDGMRFTPDKIEVKHGETIKIVVKNEGKQLHEFVLGTKKELEEHAALMVKFPNMEHDEPHMAHVDACKAGVIIWNFNKAGNFDFACLIAGHCQAGIVGTINVTKGEDHLHMH